MTDQEIDEAITAIDTMARSIGQRFIPDPVKLSAFRVVQQVNRSILNAERCRSGGGHWQSIRKMVSEAQRLELP